MLSDGAPGLRDTLDRAADNADPGGMTNPHAIPPEFADAPWTRVPGAALKLADSVPTMLHRQEQKAYYWLTREQIGGPGAVVDLGAFAGGSTARLAQGLVDSGRDTLVHAYDRYTVDWGTKQRYLYRQGIPEFDGEDILPLARRLLAPWEARIRLHIGEIQDAVWNPADGPIALLVLDACKRTYWTDSTARIFYPHLVAGQSVINQQDFLQWNQPWLVPHMVLMADFFEPLAFVRGTSMLYRCTRVPTVEDLAGRDVDGMDDDQLVEAILDSKRRFRGWGIGAALDRMVAAVRLNPGVRHYWDMKDPDQTGAS